MNWKRIDNSIRVQNAGVYTDWKQQIADDCFNRCVYCSISESHWGGIDHYHIDHYRPESKFKSLANSITNLFYACPVCNKFKSDDWPNEASDLDVICYPDPSQHDYSDLFAMDLSNFKLDGKYVSAKYIINRLYLNRAQLIFERRESVLKVKGESLLDEAVKLVEKLDDIKLFRQLVGLIASITLHLNMREKIIPYRLTELQKPKGYRNIKSSSKRKAKTKKG